MDPTEKPEQGTVISPPSLEEEPKPRGFQMFFEKFKANWKKISIPIVIILVVLSILFLRHNATRKTLPSITPEKWDKLVLDQKYAPVYTLSPQEERKYGIFSQEVFILKTKDSQSEDFVRENLISSRPVKITQINDKEFKIVPATGLGAEEIISMSVKDNEDYSWIFQTAPKLKIIDSLPRNEATNVPKNTGIEVTFNNDSFNLKNSDIEIQPSIDFRIEKHDEKASIVPLNPLRPKTVYQVTIKKSLSLLSGNDFLSDNYNFSFQTGDENAEKGRIRLAEDFQEVFPDEPLITKVYAGDWNYEKTIRAEIYKFSSIEQFISSRSNLDKITCSWVRYFSEENPVDTKELAKIAQVDLKLQTKDNLQYLQLPQNLEEGRYFIQFWYDDSQKVEQLWVQSSSLVGYLSVGKVQTAVWVNSLKNEPLDPSVINVFGTGDNYSTNSENWASFSTPSLFGENLKNYLLIKNPNGQELVLPVDNLSKRAKPNEVVADDYWSYIYHERDLYKPNDTFNFWGVVKNRDSGIAPTSVDIYIGDDLSQSVTTLTDGSYLGKIQLTDAPIGYKSISARINGVVLAQSSFRVADYVKPELKIEVEGNKKAIYAGESVDYKARVTFFDGTPASNVELYVHSESSGGQLDKTQAVADAHGEITFKYQSKLDAPSYYRYPRYEGVVVSAIKSGESPSDGSGSIYVYGSRLQIKTSSSQVKDQAEVQATVNTLDLDLINNKGLSDPVSGVAINQKVEITTTKIWWEKKQNGTYYDFVEKTTSPKFDYIRHEEVSDKKDLYTDNGGKINYHLNLELEKSYQVNLKTIDSQGSPEEKISYFYYSQYQDNSNQNQKAYLNLDRDTNLFSLGNEVDLKIQKNGSDYPKTDASRFLFVVANRGKQEIYRSDTPEFKFNFEQKYVPGVYVGSIIFNGRYYEEVTASCKSGWECGGYDYYYYSNDYFFNPILIRYQKTDSQLEVNIVSDKAKYQPGDEANVTVKVTKNGSPVGNASVQLTSVDEALAAIGGVNTPSILTSLYHQVTSLIYYNYYSHKPVLPEGPVAEQGGGGGARDLFKDTAFFSTGKTNENGEATFTIQLPDNITNWLTYAQALTDTIDAGQAESSLVASKEFFVTNQFPHIVTTKDSSLVAVSSFGNVLTQDAKIPMEVIFTKDDQEVTKGNLLTDAYKESYFDFPKLAVGDYKLTIQGKYQNYEDGVALPLKVIDSRLDFNMVKNQVLEKGESLKSFSEVNPAVGKPLKLIVTDEGKGKYYYDLYRYCFQQSNRLEKRISSMRADQILSSRFKETDCLGYNKDISQFQGSDGGLRQVEWGGSDLETTLWAVYVDPSLFDKNKLIEYFKNFKADKTEQKIWVNWGLTLLGTPKIIELNQLANSASSFREKVLSALALYSAGNKEKAKELYMNILSEYAYANKPYLRIEADSKKTDYDTYALDTSYVLLLGALVSKDYNQGFSLYLRDYSGMVTGVVFDIANISYLETILSSLPDKDTIVNFKTSTQKLTKNLTQEGFLKVNLKSNDLDNISLSVTEGKADASLSYYVTPDEFSQLESDKRISLKKKVTKVKGSSGNEIKIGDILEIELSYDFDGKAPLGCYLLTDHIPSGTTLLDNPDNFGLSIGRSGWLYPEKTNILKGCAYNSPWWKEYFLNRSVYFLRVTAAGKYLQEPAIIQSSLDRSIFQKTSEEYLTVAK